MIPLGLLTPGEHGEITEIRLSQTSSHCCTGRNQCDCRALDMGLRIGNRVQMLNNGSPILLKVDESRIAVDRAMAMKIMIKEVRR